MTIRKSLALASIALVGVLAAACGGAPAPDAKAPEAPATPEAKPEEATPPTEEAPKPEDAPKPDEAGGEKKEEKK